MSFGRPTLSDLIARARSDIQARLPGADASLRHSPLDVLARTHAGAASGLYAYLDYLAQQILPDTADGEFLARHASIWGIRRKAAIGTRITTLATGVDGTVIAAGTQAVRIDGQAFDVLEDATISAGSASVSMEAVEAGPDNPEIGSSLTFSSAIVGLNATTQVTAIDVPGALEEDDESLLSRLLARIRTPPQGGSKADYKAWALAQSGVTRAWVYEGWMGVGTVGVAFVMDDRDNIIPQAADIAAVQSALDDLRPVTAELNVFAPVEEPIDIVVSINPDTPEIRAAITAELADFFARDAQPGGTIYLSRISETISLSAGEFSHSVDLPDRDITVEAQQIPSLGSVAFV